MKPVGEIIQSYLGEKPRLDSLAQALYDEHPDREWGHPIPFGMLPLREQDTWRERARAALRHIGSQ